MRPFGRLTMVVAPLVLAILCGCASDDDDGKKGAPGPSIPVIQSISALGLPAPPGGTVTVEVSAQSPEGLTLSYAWSLQPPTWVVSGGSGGPNITITAPAAYGETGIATVTVTDSEGGVATGKVGLSTDRNIVPVIHTIAAYPNPIMRGNPVTAEVTASDPNGDTLSYTWTVPAGFTLDTGGDTPQIQATADSYANGRFLVTVDDGNGGGSDRLHLCQDLARPVGPGRAHRERGPGKRS